LEQEVQLGRHLTQPLLQEVHKVQLQLLARFQVQVVAVVVEELHKVQQVQLQVELEVQAEV
jgi:hypothetical protein